MDGLIGHLGLDVAFIVIQYLSSDERFWNDGELMKLYEERFTLITNESSRMLYTLDGELHRRNGPACIWYYPDGSIKLTERFWYDRLHCLDAPSYVIYDGRGQILMERWYENTRLHRLDGPAHTEYESNGKISYQCWYLCNRKSRLGDGPTQIIYQPNGNIREIWYDSDRIGRIDPTKPYIIEYYPSGQICMEKTRRQNTKALIISYDETGKKTRGVITSFP